MLPKTTSGYITLLLRCCVWHRHRENQTRDTTFMCAVYCTYTCVHTFINLLTRICIHVSSVCTLHVLHMYCTTTCTHSLMVVGVVIHVHVLPGQLPCKDNDSPELTCMLYCVADNVHCMYRLWCYTCTVRCTKNFANRSQSVCDSSRALQFARYS